MNLAHACLLVSSIFFCSGEVEDVTKSADLKCYFCQGSCDVLLLQDCREALGEGKEAKCLSYSYKTGDSVMVSKNCVSADAACEDFDDIPESSCLICDSDLCNGEEAKTDPDLKEQYQQSEEDDGSIDVEIAEDAQHEEESWSFLSSFFSFFTKKSEL